MLELNRTRAGGGGEPGLLAVSLCVLLLTLAGPAAARPAAGSAHPSDPAGATSARGEWPSFGGDPHNTKYSPLEQIDRTNFGRLEIAWVWRSPSVEVAEQDRRVRPGQFKPVPVMADGLLYVATEIAQVAAIDPGTGETVWLFDPESYRAGRPANIGFQHRGVAFWKDGDDARIFVATHDRKLWALSAITGEPYPDFGDGGAVDLLPEGGAGHFGRRVNPRHITHSSPPIVVGDVVIVGSIVHDGPTHKEAPPGHVRAFDARTGELRWIFHTIAQPGELGHETWRDGSWQYTGAANVWSMMAADESRGLVYLPTGTPTNDMYGGHRLGDNLFAESIVCLEAATGRRVWHFQAVHHGLWDYDFPTAPNLVDINVGGRRIEALAQVSKQGFVYVFDRVTGEPVWPIVERPVPQTDVPGERSSPTQPFPTRPPAFERQGTSEDALIDLTPELRAEALEIAERFRLGPLYTPPTLETEEQKGTLMLPSTGGGANWPGAAFDPETGILYVPSMTSVAAFPLVQPDPNRSNFRYVLKSWFQGVGGPRGLPLVKPPWGRVTAIDLDRGEIVWTTPNGEGPTSHPALRDLDLGPLGGGSGAPLLTKTLLFVTQPRGIGEANSPRINVFDKTNGTLLGHIPLPDTANANPVSYLYEGRQYLVVAVGGGPFFGGFSDEDIAQWDEETQAQLRALSSLRGTSPELVALRLPAASG